MKQTSKTLGAFLSTDVATIPIADGVLTITSAMVIAQAQTGTADDIDTITPNIESINSGDLYFILIEADAGNTITLKHGTGNMNFVNAADIVLGSGERALLFGSATAGFDDVALSAGGGGMTSFSLAGDSGTPQTIADGNTLSVLGGAGIDTVASATDTITVAVDSTVATLTGAQALTNKDLTDASNTFAVTAAEIVSGTLLHERGGLEADVSAYAGVPFINGGATTEIKYNHAASAAPTANDDSGDGYVVGSRWIDTTNDKEYVCLDNTLTTAVWTETTGAGGGASGFSIVRNTASGTITGGSWQTVPIAEGTDPDGLITVASNQMTFANAGWYTPLEVSYFAATFAQAMFRLRDVTNGVTLATTNSHNNSGARTSRAFKKPFEIPAANTVVELQVYLDVNGSFSQETTPASTGETYDALNWQCMKWSA